MVRDVGCRKQWAPGTHETFDMARGSLWKHGVEFVRVCRHGTRRLTLRVGKEGGREGGREEEEEAEEWGDGSGHMST